MGMRENWKLFVESCKAKAESHKKMADYWDRVHNTLSLILIVLSAITTVLAVYPDMPKLATTGMSGLTTLLSAIAGFLQPSARKQVQAESSKGFQSLMLRMIRCETDDEYEELWNEYSKEILAEPFLPRNYQVAVTQEYSMSPELLLVVETKEDEVDQLLQQLERSGDGESSAETEGEQAKGVRVIVPYDKSSKPTAEKNEIGSRGSPDFHHFYTKNE